MPRRAFTADVAALSLQAASKAIPHVKQVRFNGADDVVVVDFVYGSVAAPVAVTILCADMDSYPQSCNYFLSLEDAPAGYDQILLDIQSGAKIRTLGELVRKVDKSFIHFADSARTGNSPTTESAIVIHGTDSEDSGDSGDSGDDDDDVDNKAISIINSDDDEDGAASTAQPGHETEPYIVDYSSDEGMSRPRRLAPTASRTNPRISAKAKTSLRHRALLSSRPWPKKRNLGGLSTPNATQDDAQGDEDAEDNGLRYYIFTGLPNPLRDRISQDLKAVRDCGFYFGVLSGMDGSTEDNLLAVSIQTSALGLSHQMLLAWDLDPSVYIVLLIHLRSRYTGYEALINSTNSDVDLSFRIGKCPRYKPSREHAYAAFGSSTTLDASAKGGPTNTATDFSKILISGSLGNFMSDSFLPLARYRDDIDCSWADAVNALVNRDQHLEGGGAVNFLPSSSRQKSFPLIAMQFAMDQLTNCTEYCQACHHRLEKGLGSLKPTVCSRDLCLFQYITLGLGRSVEYEVLCQPKVVDLLINFCYAALRSSLGPVAVDPVRAYPTALPLKVLDLDNGLNGIYDNRHGSRPSFLLPSQSSGEPSIQQYAHGQWVAIYFGDLTKVRNSATETANVAGTAAPPTSPALITLRHAIVDSVDYANSTIYLDHGDHGDDRYGYTSAHRTPSQIFRYTKDFDDVPKPDKAALLLLVLDTLPPVASLKSQLEKPTVNDLRSVPGVSPAAAVLLGWIIATNRSCILQIHDSELMVREGSEGNASIPTSFLQFCFLQGSPEADFEFQQELDKAVAITKNHRYPTLLAWHGSNISNWHSILRTGLDYSTMAHGRAFGNGVYFSNNFNTSLQYATAAGQGAQWPQAVLDLRSVVSLNEVVNATDLFTSSYPHYVVQQRNWSRCRFLFARREHTLPVAQSAGRLQAAAKQPLASGSTTAASLSGNPQCFFEQDPQRPACGPTGSPIFVPVASMPAPQDALEDDAHKRKRHKPTPRQQRNRGKDGEVMEASDLAFLPKATDAMANAFATPTFPAVGNGTGTAALTPAPTPAATTAAPAVTPVTAPAATPTATSAASNTAIAQSVNSNVTPFQPGTLDRSSLLQLPPPSWGTSQAQRALSREVDRMHKLQQDTPLCELGWYIDFAQLDNLFQWIVELHSFDTGLPLAKDMAKHGVTAIVCEMRFGADYPMSPPLVRVIRPRFLPFLQGGGGNVTSGGAMCMELLTSTGWTPANQIDAVLLQVRLAICAEEQPARLDPTHFWRDYAVGEAFEAYRRAAATHGWAVPADMRARMTF